MTPEVKVVEVDHERRAYTFEITVPLSMAVLMLGNPHPDGDMLKPIATAFPRALKDHRCQDCLLKIEKGETYRRDVLSYDGRAYTWLSHIACNTESLRHVGEFSDDGWSEGFLVRDIDRADWSPEYAAWYEAAHAIQTRAIPAQCDEKPPETRPEHTES